MKTEHILVIEDDTSVGALLDSCLNAEGFQVTVAESGELGMRLIEEQPPDLVVLDLNLPGMSGLDVCRHLRSDPWMSKIAVLMLTGKTEEDDVVTGLEVGADDYMVKPFSPKLLVARVRALLRRSRELREETASQHAPIPESGLPLLEIKTLGYCDLRLEERHMPWAVKFSPAQRQLMAMLVAAPDGQVSQDEVQVNFWPDSTSARARSSFDSLLSRVRRTLDDGLAPFDSKQYLVVRRGILCLQHCRIDAQEFARLVRKGLQQAAARCYWQAELAFSSAFSLWQGTFQPADFGSDAAILFQDELEQLYQEASAIFARILAESGRHQEAIKLLRSAQRYNPTDDLIVRLHYQLCLALDHPGQAKNVLEHYREHLRRMKFSSAEIEAILADMPTGPPRAGWLTTT